MINNYLQKVIIRDRYFFLRITHIIFFRVIFMMLREFTDCPLSSAFEEYNKKKIIQYMKSFHKYLSSNGRIE